MSELQNIELEKIIRQINSSDSTASADCYLSFSDYNDAEFAIRGCPSFIFKSTENFLSSIGSPPLWCGRSGCAGDDENRVLDRYPPELPQDIEDISIASLDTGDILLFPGKTETCKTLKQLHWSAFTHAGIVVEIDRNLFVLTSTVHPFLYGPKNMKNADFSSIEILPLSFVCEKFLPTYCDQIIVKRLDSFPTYSQKLLLHFGFNEFFREEKPLRHDSLSRIKVQNNNVNLSAQFVAYVLERCDIVKRRNLDLFVPECFNRMSGKLYKLI